MKTLCRVGLALFIGAVLSFSTTTFAIDQNVDLDQELVVTVDATLNTITTSTATKVEYATYIHLKTYNVSERPGKIKGSEPNLIVAYNRLSF